MDDFNPLSKIGSCREPTTEQEQAAMQFCFDEIAIRLEDLPDDQQTRKFVEQIPPYPAGTHGNRIWLLALDAWEASEARKPSTNQQPFELRTR